ncbi:MAG TPA: hypothetical protein VG276_07040 [Actinomycetes bacterium]|nr:hypothetical protein [Actinomycetes bacterium]
MPARLAPGAPARELIRDHVRGFSASIALWGAVAGVAAAHRALRALGLGLLIDEPTPILSGAIVRAGAFMHASHVLERYGLGSDE